MAQDARLIDRRSLVCASMASLGSLTLVGCAGVGGDAPEADDTGEVDELAAETIEVGIARPVCLDPYGATAPADVQIVFQLFDPLTRYDFETGTLTCLAAESYLVSEDQRTLTFTLRDATFHDGQSVRAIDFKRAWDRLVSPKSAAAKQWASPSVAHLLALVEGYDAVRSGTSSSLAGVSCPDERTLVVKLSAPYADFPSVVADPRLAPVPEAAEDDPQAFAASPVGNGPFKVDGALEDGGEGLDLLRFDDYAPAPAEVARVLMTFQESVTDSFRAFESGDLTVSACPIENADANAASWKSNDDERLQLNANRHIVLGSEPVVSYLACNTASQPLDNPDVRRAISMAIDRDALSKRVFRDVRMPAYGIVPPDVPGYREEGWSAAQHDVTGANRLLDAVYPKDEEGERGLNISLLYSTDCGHQKAMEEIVSDLEEAGIACELEEVEFDELHRRLDAGEFSLARVDWTPDVPVMDNVLFPLFHSSCIGAHNYARYANERVDELIDEARTLASNTERQERLRAAEGIIAADMPVIPYIFGAHAVAGSRRIAKLLIDPQGYAHFFEAQLAR